MKVKRIVHPDGYYITKERIYNKSDNKFYEYWFLNHPLQKWKLGRGSLEASAKKAQKIIDERKEVWERWNK